MMQTEMEKLMIARGNDEFAFRALDKAQVPKKRVRPQRMLITFASAILGGVLGLTLIWLGNLRSRKLRSASHLP
jgi:uncharacterized protein involved in exopolysaccharide biosynthesis